MGESYMDLLESDCSTIEQKYGPAIRGYVMYYRKITSIAN
jgi:hypothetical protein